MTNSTTSEPAPLTIQVDLSWRSLPLPDAATLSSTERIGWVDRYRLTKQAGHALTVDEMRHLLSCLAASRAEVARRKSADNKSAKAVTVAPDLADL